MRGLSYVEQFTLEREHTVPIPANHSQPADSQWLGWVSLSEDQRAIHGVPAARIVGVIQLGYPLDLGVLGGVAFLVQLTLSIQIKGSWQILWYFLLTLQKNLTNSSPYIYMSNCKWWVFWLKSTVILIKLRIEKLNHLQIYMAFDNININLASIKFYI